MGSIKLLSVAVLFMKIVMLCHSMTMDEIISNSAQSTNEFQFFQDNGDKPMIKVELDMVFTPEQWDEIQKAEQDAGDSSGRYRRKAIRQKSYRWPNGQIPYELASGVFNTREQNEIQKALDEWELLTCIKFNRATSRDSNRIRFNNGQGCYSNVGMVDGVQEIGLASGCRYKGVVVHEVGHAVGFQHEQTRPDRDAHVQIIRENIPPHLYYNFQKYTVTSVDDFEVPYDYKSVMHYGKTAFSTNGGLTIKTYDPAYQDVIGNREGLSFADVKLANLMYNCGGRCGKTCPDNGFLDKDCKCMCPGEPVKECSGTGTGTGTGSRTTTPTVTETCKDMHTSCSQWAQNGECSAYKFFMGTYCKLSCNLCSPEGAKTCADMAKYCPYWQGKGYCTSRKYVTYMSSNCAKTCNTCPSGTSRVNTNTADNSNSVSQTDVQSSGVTSFSSVVTYLVLLSCAVNVLLL